MYAIDAFDVLGKRAGEGGGGEARVRDIVRVLVYRMRETVRQTDTETEVAVAEYIILFLDTAKTA